jgi:hypothetical protein
MTTEADMRAQAALARALRDKEQGRRFPALEFVTQDDLGAFSWWRIGPEGSGPLNEERFERTMTSDDD